MRHTGDAINALLSAAAVNFGKFLSFFLALLSPCSIDSSWMIERSRSPERRFFRTDELAGAGGEAGGALAAGDRAEDGDVVQLFAGLGGAEEKRSATHVAAAYEVCREK